MSHAYRYRYSSEEIERMRAKRRAANFIASVNSFLVRYRQRYQEYIARGFEQYIPEEMRKLNNDLIAADRYLQSDTQHSKAISLEIGSYINGLERLANRVAEQIRRQKVAEAFAKKEEQENTLLSDFSSILRTYTDPIAMSFAEAKLVELRRNIINGDIASSQALKSSIDSIMSEAAENSKKWKQEKLEQDKQQIAIANIEDAKKAVVERNIEDKQKSEELLARLNNLKASMLSSKSVENVDKELNSIDKAADEAMITEDTRKEYVKRIVKQLRRQEFTIETVELKGEGDNSIVKIVAKKPSGACAEARIGLDNKLCYKFDNYEGNSCLKDIEKFNVDLEEIYGIKLDEKKDLWENPDRIEKKAESNQTVRSRRI